MGDAKREAVSFVIERVLVNFILLNNQGDNKLSFVEYLVKIPFFGSERPILQDKGKTINKTIHEDQRKHRIAIMVKSLPYQRPYDIFLKKYLSLKITTINSSSNSRNLWD